MVSSSGRDNGCHAMKPLNHGFSSFPTTVFEVMSKLAADHQSVNLGQGFPDDEGPDSMKKIASTSLYEHHNQYPSMLGVPELRQAVAKHSQVCQRITVDWATEALITVGATEGIAACFLGLCNPGDEVIRAAGSRQHAVCLPALARAQFPSPNISTMCGLDTCVCL